MTNEKNPVTHFQPDSEFDPQVLGQAQFDALARLDRGMRRVTHDLWAERRRQEAKWGEQNHDFGYYQGILMEELGEANKEWIEAEAFERKPMQVDGQFNPCQQELAKHYRKNLRVELVQTLAVLHAMIECGDRNRWFQ